MRDGEVRIYVCGLTPSAQAHLGHARSFLFFDVLRRYLTHRGYRVTYVQNVTDIDDRSINARKETGEDYHAIVDRYYAEFKASMRKLGVLEYDRGALRDAVHRADSNDDSRAHRGRPRLRRARRHLLSRRDVCELRAPRQPQYRRARSRRAHRGGRAQGRSARLCALEVREARRAALAIRAVRRRAPGLAHRVLGDGARAARSATAPASTSTAAAPI